MGRPRLVTDTATFGGGSAAGTGSVDIPRGRQASAARRRSGRTPEGWTVAPEGMITPHFSWDEAKCRCCGCVPSIAAVVAFAGILEQARHKLGGVPIAVWSWCRCPDRNAAVGGAPNSLHLEGQAADIEVSGMTPRRVLQTLHNWPGGLGRYKTHTHLDAGRKRRWSG
jgi:hypothetical protein